MKNTIKLSIALTGVIFPIITLYILNKAKYGAEWNNILLIILSIVSTLGVLLFFLIKWLGRKKQSIIVIHDPKYRSKAIPLIEGLDQYNLNFNIIRKEAVNDDDFWLQIENSRQHKSRKIIALVPRETMSLDWCSLEYYGYIQLIPIVIDDDSLPQNFSDNYFFLGKLDKNSLSFISKLLQN